MRNFCCQFHLEVTFPLWNKYFGVVAEWLIGHYFRQKDVISKEEWKGKDQEEDTE